ncbi:MAG: ABC transporter substrate-binding protein, partial [Lachnospiraceae bacterium]|nr:ABC transporter substrate-binding protein [Lachnospiraceae bacterium]
MKKHGKILPALLLVLGLAVLGGCSDESSSDDPNKGGADKVNAATGEPEFGGSIVVGITQDLDSLDPHKARSAGTEEVLFNIFEGIVKPDKDGNLVPAVASDVVIAEDGMSYTFTLREGVKFHNGELVTAEDVVYSLKRCAGLLETNDPEVKVTSALSCISEIEASTDAAGKSIITIKLSEANTELLGYLTGAIIPKNYDRQNEAPVGTGPFRFVSYTRLQNFVIEKNPDYYGTPAYLDKVTFKISADTDAA